MALHVFVAMPFGVKEGIDFDMVYFNLIKPALECEGFEVFRADEELRAGNIRTDIPMFGMNWASGMPCGRAVLY